MTNKLKNTFLVAAAILTMTTSSISVFAQTVNLQLFYDGKNHSYNAEEIKINVNGTSITGMDMPPVAINDRTYVPIRAVFEAAGAEVHWNEATKEVYLIKGNNVVTVQIDSVIGNVNGGGFEMDVAPKLINDRTMIPVRHVAEKLGMRVGWDEATRTVDVYDINYGPTTEDENNNNSDIEENNSNAGNNTNNNNNTNSNININNNTNANTPPSVPSNKKDSTTSYGTITGPEITVLSVMPPSSASDQSFKINASGAIERYDITEIVSSSPPKIAVDIYNSSMGISSKGIDVSGSAVTGIRTSQFAVEPTKISRVVFDLSSVSDFNVNLSPDKKTLSLTFGSNEVSNVNVTSAGGTDTVSITGSSFAPSASFSYNMKESKLIIDMPNTKCLLNSEYSGYPSSYVNTIRASQFDQSSTRVVLELNSPVEYSLTQSGNSTVIKLVKSNLKNVNFENNMLVLSKQRGLDVNEITHNDDYINLTYSLTLPGNYGDAYGDGTYYIHNDSFDSIKFNYASNGNSIITFSEKQIFAYQIIEDSENIYIKALNPKEVYPRVLVLDAGHGKDDPGTNGSGYIEKNLNLQLALKVFRLLEADGYIKVYMTRMADTYPTNPYRAQMGNQIADLFVSIHHNAVQGNTTANGLETLYVDHNNEKPGNLTSQIAAQFIQKYLISATGANDRGIVSRPDLIVLNSTKVPAVLIESGFLTNPDEAAKLGSEEYQNRMANAIYSAITDMFKQYDTR